MTKTANTPLTRREFGKTAGAAAGVTLALGWSPFAYARNEQVRVALIGTGSQGCLHIEDGLAGTQEVDIGASADCLLFNLAKGWHVAGGDPALKEHLYVDYREMLDKERNAIDAVIVATPFKTHHRIVMDCLDAGNYVFCEKTMAHTYEACREIVTKCHETGLFVQVGHQRRYNPEFNYAASQIADAERLGRVTLIEGRWHRHDPWRRLLPRKKSGDPYELTAEEQRHIPDLEKHWNWRVHGESSYGLVGELCTHHVDVANFLLGKPPACVWGTGGTDYWRDGRTTYDNVQLVYEYDLGVRDRGFTAISARTDEQGDHLRELNRPYTVRLTWSGTLQDPDGSVGMRVVGQRGVFDLRERWFPEQQGCVFRGEPHRSYIDSRTGERVRASMSYSGTSTRVMTHTGYARIEHVTPEPVPFEDELGPSIFDKTPDVRQFEAFARHIKEGGKPRTNEMAGLMASIAVIAGHEAVTTKELVEIDPAVYSFDFKTPHPFERNYRGVR
jgi:predicted dehydrogenase